MSANPWRAPNTPRPPRTRDDEKMAAARDARGHRIWIEVRVGDQYAYFTREEFRQKGLYRLREEVTITLAEMRATRARRRAQRKAPPPPCRPLSPGAAINAQIRGSMRNSLNTASYGRSWEQLVGYTLSDLVNRLESRFADGMTWDDLHLWHIDHIRPLASFNITGAECDDFRAAWALENLQPLWAIDNIRKGAKWSP